MTGNANVGASDTLAVDATAPPLAEDIRRAIGKLTSFHDGDMGVIATIACGRRAIPALRAILFARVPSGLYETRRRAVEALAQLHADDVLIAFLATSRDITDPVEQTGEDAVTNAVARALAGSADDRVAPLLFALAERPPLAGVVAALGKRRCVEALPYFIKALAEDFTRPAAEEAIRGLGVRARDALLATAIRPAPSEPETVSRKRQRRSALQLLGEIKPLARTARSKVSALIHDSDPEIAVLACKICLASAATPAKVAAVLRLIDLLPAADWRLGAKIEECLVTHFDSARDTIETVLRYDERGADLDPPRAATMRALSRIAIRATSGAPHIGI